MRLSPGSDLAEPAAPLARLRICLGLVVALKAWQVWTLIPALVAPLAIRVPYFAGFVPGNRLLTGLAVGIGIAGLCMAAGLFSRPAATAASLGLPLVLLADQQLYSNHLYLLILLSVLLAVSDSGAALSFDAIFRSTRREWVASWPNTLFRAQLSIVYGFAALAKINESYLSGEALRSFTSKPWATGWPDALFIALSLGSIVGELFVACGLWWEPVRRWAVVVGLGLHVGMIALVDHPLLLVIFAAEMLLLYPLFFTEQVTTATTYPARRLRAVSSLERAATG